MRTLTRLVGSPAATLRGVAGLVATLSLGACSNGGNDFFIDGGQTEVPFQELVDQGVTRYLDLYSPSSTSQSGNVISHQFGAGDGPLCLTGKPYTMATRDEGSEDLMIFLQGGGACWFSPVTGTFT